MIASAVTFLDLRGPFPLFDEVVLVIGTLPREATKKEYLALEPFSSFHVGMYLITQNTTQSVSVSSAR